VFLTNLDKDPNASPAFRPDGSVIVKFDNDKNIDEGSILHKLNIVNDR
jgi:hypothetical protein